ncbi:SprT-like domain-containing protein [bacterium]|nr:SprT-like domain-containing protein [bacterium]
MKIKIIYNSNIMKKELLFIESNLAYFKKNKMFFYFPFESIKKTSDKNIIKQIHKDEKHFQIEKIKKILEKQWAKKEKLVFNCLYKYNQKEKIFNIQKEYKCFLSFYGCYGYYNFSDEIYININAKFEFIIETIIHELIHLLIYKNMNKKSYHQIEEKVDKIFIDSSLNKIFPDYKVQKF